MPKAIDLEQLPQQLFVASLDEQGTPAAGLHWSWGTRALLAYRRGDAELAVEYVRKSEELELIEFAHALNLAVLALAHHQLQHSDEARKALEEASQLVIHLKDDSKNKGHHDLLIAQILFSEAEALINGKTEPKPPSGDTESSPTDPASPPPDKPSSSPSKPTPKDGTD